MELSTPGGYGVVFFSAMLIHIVPLFAFFFFFFNEAEERKIFGFALLAQKSSLHLTFSFFIA